MQRRSSLNDLGSLALAGSAGSWPVTAQANLTVTPLADNLHLLSGAGGNIAVLAGPDGLLLVDSGLPESTAGILAETAKLAKPQITRLINTHWHQDHTGGNVELGKSGAKILAHANCKARLSQKVTVAALNRTFDPLPPEGLPSETFTSKGALQHGGESLRYAYLPPAHTDGDIVIHFENANVFQTGDLMFNGAYPFIDYSTGGSLAGMAAAVERMAKMIDGTTRIIPGHGAVCRKTDLQEYGDLLAFSLDGITQALRQGKTLEQLQASKPFAKYDDKWGQGFLKPELWIALNYQGTKAQQD